jgi:hypothetical protein
LTAALVNRALDPGSLIRRADRPERDLTMEFLVLAVLAAAVSAVGLVLGMLVARRLDRWLVDRDEKPRDESDESDESD